MLSAKSSSALAPTVSMEVMRLGSLFLVLAAVPCGCSHVAAQDSRALCLPSPRPGDSLLTPPRAPPTQGSGEAAAAPPLSKG